jgi:hypothetical protein
MFVDWILAMQTPSKAPQANPTPESGASSTDLTPQYRSHRPAVEWHKPKRKRGRDGSKDSRRRRLEWRNLDKEWRIFQQRWMKPSKKPGKKPLSIIRLIQFK